MRTVNQGEHEAKRNKILDAALKVISQKGYRHTSIQDILDALAISKGAFYHYFSSKQELLTALVERMKKEASDSLAMIADDPGLTAVQKFNRYFETSAQWKADNSQLTLSALRLWYDEQNIAFRHKVHSEALKYTSALFETFLRQGIREKSFAVKRPQETALIVAGMALSVADEVTLRLLSAQSPTTAQSSVAALLEVYVSSVEKILGAPQHSLEFFKKPDAQAALSQIVHTVMSSKTI